MSLETKMTTRPLFNNFGDHFITRSAQNAALLKSPSFRRRYQDEMNLAALRKTGAPVLSKGIRRAKHPSMSKATRKTVRTGKSPSFESAALAKSRRTGRRPIRIGNPSAGGVTYLPSTKILRVNNER